MYLVIKYCITYCSLPLFSLFNIYILKCQYYFYFLIFFTVLFFFSMAMLLLPYSKSPYFCHSFILFFQDSHPFYNIDHSLSHCLFLKLDHIFSDSPIWLDFALNFPNYYFLLTKFLLSSIIGEAVFTPLTFSFYKLHFYWLTIVGTYQQIIVLRIIVCNKQVVIC